MDLDNRFHPVPKEIRQYLAEQFAAVHSDLLSEAFPDLDLERKNIRIQILIEGIIHSLSRLSAEETAAPREERLKQANQQIKEVYPTDRHLLIDMLTEFISPTLLGRPAGRHERGAA